MSARCSAAAAASTSASNGPAADSSGPARTTRAAAAYSAGTGRTSTSCPTSERSTPALLELICSQAAFHANRLASLVCAARSSTRAGSGRSSPDAFAYFDRAAYSWRTSQDSLLPGSATYSVTWPPAGIWADGFAYEVLTSARLIDASGCSSLLPTPSAMEPEPSSAYVDEMREAGIAPAQRLY